MLHLRQVLAERIPEVTFSPLVKVWFNIFSDEVI